MTTEVNTTLPIPEQVIVGSGGYTIPENRYAHFQANVSGTWYRNGSQAGVGSSGAYVPTSASNSCKQWLKEGDSIDVQTSFPTLTDPNDANTGAVNGATAYTRIRVNSTPVCIAHFGIITHSVGTAVYLAAQSTGEAGWSASLYRIPKANLPTGLAEGE